VAEQPPTPAPDPEDEDASPSPEALARMLEEIERRLAGKE
jgi:hypothetical protein